MVNIIQVKISDNNNLDQTSNYNNIDNIFNLKNNNYILFNDSYIRSFIKKKNDYKILNAYNKLKPYAFKADLAKYYIGYHLGGLVTDINNYFVNNDILNYNDVFFKDIPEDAGDQRAVVCGLFYVNPKNIFLKKTIDVILNNCAINYYGNSALDITGPNVLGKALVDNRHIFGKFSVRPDYKCKSFYLNNKLIADYKPNGLAPGDSGIIGGNSYVDIWNNRNVYGEKK